MMLVACFFSRSIFFREIPLILAHLPLRDSADSLYLRHA
jgi:hypothetical protein